MARPFDPLSLAGIALTGLLNGDPFLSAYNWQKYESNVAANPPRGYVNVSSSSALLLGDLPEKLEFEIVFEGKPKTITSAEAVATAVAHAIRSDIGAILTTFLVSDNAGAMSFFGKAEDLKLSQRVVGEIRQYTVGFSLHAQWNVQFVPD